LLKTELLLLLLIFTDIIIIMKLLTLRMKRHHLYVLFLIQVYLGIKFRPSVLETVGLPVPARYIRDSAWSASVPRVKTVPLPDVHKLLILFEGASAY
jgi:hypothetical protein